MLSAHFWMGIGATVAAATVMGLSLGNYVTSPQTPSHGAQAAIDALIGEDDIEAAILSAQKGPGVIHCTGCGPTLAERRWQADMGGLDADVTTDADPDPDPIIAQVDQPVELRTLEALPPLAVGETAPPPALVTRVGQDAVPPPAVVATAAESVLP